MVQAARSGGADIHAGAFAHRLQTLQHLDRVGVVFLRHLGVHGLDLYELVGRSLFAHDFKFFRFLYDFVVVHGESSVSVKVDLS